MTRSIAIFTFFVLIMLGMNCQTQQTSTSRSLSAPTFQAYTCSGNEPFWNIKVEADKITFRQLGETPVVYPYLAPKQSRKTIQFETATEVAGKKSILTFSLEENSCTDNMSGKAYGFTVHAEKDGASFQGCGDKL